MCTVRYVLFWNCHSMILPQGGAASPFPNHQILFSPLQTVQKKGCAQSKHAAGWETLNKGQIKKRIYKLCVHNKLGGAVAPMPPPHPVVLTWWFWCAQVFYRDNTFAMGHVVFRWKTNVVGNEPQYVSLFRCIQNMNPVQSFNTCYTGGESVLLYLPRYVLPLNNSSCGG